MQKSASLSTAEVEWYAASESGKEIICVHSILFDFGFEQDGTTKLYKDSRAVIVMADNPVDREGSRQHLYSQAFHRRACPREAH